jgi:DNA replication protein DnaC
LLRFTDGSFLKHAENILITGLIGVGKSYIASALGHLACQFGYRVNYFIAQKLFATLRMSRADESYLRQVKRLEKQDLLIIDDFGMQPLDEMARMMLLEIIEDRHQKSSTIIASQLPVEKWYDVIGESIVADAILDKLVHTSHRIELSGESMRKKKKV